MSITVKYDVTVDLSAREWELYLDMDGVDGVARALSADASRILSACTNHAEACAQFDRVSVNYAEFGACDSEPRYAFFMLCDKVYGPQGD